MSSTVLNTQYWLGQPPPPREVPDEDGAGEAERGVDEEAHQGRRLPSAGNSEEDGRQDGGVERGRGRFAR